MRRPVVDPRFAQLLRELRQETGLSLRALAQRVYSSKSHLHGFETGQRPPTAEAAQQLDEALGAGGRLAALVTSAPKAASSHEDQTRSVFVTAPPVRAGTHRGYVGEGIGAGISIKEADVRRRVMLEMAGLAPMVALEAFRLDSLPAAGTEALRHDLSAALDGQPADVAEWEEIAWNYGCTYADTPPRVLFEELRVDLLVACMQLGRISDDATRRCLQQVIARLSVFMAQTFGNLGDLRAGYRWWRTARRYADASGENDARVWVRGQEIIRGLYERRPLARLVLLADEARTISSAPGVGTGAVLAGRAQALAMLGSAAEARAAMDLVYGVAEQLPARVAGDTTSMYGWPEYRLRHTESFVYTYLGDGDRAEAAHHRALELYPANMFRARAQVELHRAMRLVREGDVSGGASHAQRVVEELPGEQRIEVVLEVARSVANAVPASQRHRPQVTGLREVLALPAGPSR